MLNQIRSLLHGAITTPRGDSVTAIRVPKNIARGINDMLGAPLCSQDEIERRRAAARRLADLRAAPAVKAAPKREPAPVVIYFEKDRNQRQLERIQDALGARSIVFKKLDVTGDDRTTSFVTTEARCERDELPGRLRRRQGHRRAEGTGGVRRVRGAREDRIRLKRR